MVKHRILIVGASSAIAQAVAKQYATKHAEFFLVGRNKNKLTVVAEDLLVRGAGRVEQYILDSHDAKTQKAMLNAAHHYLGCFDLVFIAHGSLPDQSWCEQDVEQTLAEFNTNALSIIVLLTLLANLMEAQHYGTIAVISSVAGDRGRRSNYVYGAAKAAINTFLQGLRARLFHQNVHVLTIKPGFVATPMTAHLKKNFLFASTEQVAKDIARAIDKKKNLIYTPLFWMPIMFLIKCLPERIAKKMSF